MTTHPSLDAMVALSRPGVVIPVVRELRGIEVDPLAAFDVLARGSSHAALLETSEAGIGDADMSIVAPRAREVLAGEDVLDQVRAACADVVVDIGIELPRFVGGAIGMLGHEHVRTIEPRVPAAANPHPCGAPTAAFLLVDELVAFDQAAGRVLAIHAVRLPASLEGFDVAAAYAAAVASLDALEAQLREGVPCDAATQPLGASAPGADPFLGVTSNIGAEAFRESVLTAREHVRSGECVQIVVSQRFDRAFTIDPLLAYRVVRAVSPAPYHVLLRLDGLHIIGASPEQLVGVLDEQVVTHPIAGTRPRGATESEDAALAAELLADPKERSEHMMLVDLGRNDVGRVSEPGSVDVERLCEVERFSHVQHLVSRVTGRLRGELHPVDALRAAFPAGTLTGAPKVRAMELIAALEPDARGPYGGVVGYVGHGRVLDMAITIRTAVLARGMASVQAGAGVVAASDPELEEAETRHKARAVLLALTLAEEVAAATMPATEPVAIGGVA
ncbi:MAG: anthranilate synthase component [Thermoleophilia bacterium]|nr:anthranilate synthase component [Thermoleophilia bacterium]